ncbi:MAG: NAD(P)/FAD-dependent oxidoreductase, partial [Oscillospiraceae bacterium]|nr:NAD(P)/FAD-dependent oxidoreductase [Oscillospiraceae bacterium]
ILLCGGGMSGLECALGLAMEGKRVTVLDLVPVEEFAREIVNFTRNMLMMLLRQHDVTLIGGEKVIAITPDGVETMDRDLVSRFHRADAVVTAFGLTPNNEDMDGFFNIVPETYAIGDCWYGAYTNGNANTCAFNFAN